MTMAKERVEWTLRVVRIMDEDFRTLMVSMSQPEVSGAKVVVVPQFKTVKDALERLRDRRVDAKKRSEELLQWVAFNVDYDLS